MGNSAKQKTPRNLDPSARTIILGDVHGCFNELVDLLSKVDAKSNDQIISVGDLICKGPDSFRVMDWAMNAPNLWCVLGNHEVRFLKHWKQGRISQEKAYDGETAEQLKPIYKEAMDFLATWPTYIDTPSLTVVHAGIDYRAGGLSEQELKTITNLRFLEGTELPWYTQYKEKKLIVFGHWVHRKPILFGDYTVGLDTGCVYGGALSALVLPERKIVQVPARKVYREKESWPTYRLSTAVDWL